MILRYFFLIPVVFVCCNSPAEKGKAKDPKTDTVSDLPKYQPQQPVPFSHQLNAKGMKCEYCHKDPSKMDSVKRNHFPNSSDDESADKMNALEIYRNKDYVHKNPSGNMTDCSRCHL